MKYHFFPIILFLCYSVMGFSQYPDFYKSRVYFKDCPESKIPFFLQRPCKQDGNLYQVTDTQIRIAYFKNNRPSKSKFYNKDYDLIEIPVDNIDFLVVQKKIPELSYSFVGVLGGAALGFGIGFLTWEKQCTSLVCIDSPYLDGIYGAFIGSASGLVVAGLIQWILYPKQKFVIDGKPENWDKHKKTLQKLDLVF